MIRHFISFGLSLVLLQSSVIAHPGHGAQEHPTGIMHYVTSPFHLSVIATAACVLIFGGAMIRHLKKSRLRAEST